MIAGPVLITGASRGIGRALAAALAARGVAVFGTSRDPRNVSDKLPGVVYLPLRLEDPASVEACAGAAGPVEVLVNNAGQSQVGPVEDASTESVENLFQMNLFGLIRLTKAFLPGMRERGRGTIVNIGSLTGSFPPPFQSAYAATKVGLEAFTKSLRGEVGRFGLKVVHVIPGYINTGIEPRRAGVESLPYADELKQFRAARNAKMDKAAPPETAAKTILRVLEKKRPKPVYYTGHFVPAMGFLKRLLSEGRMLRMIRGFYKLP